MDKHIKYILNYILNEYFENSDEKHINLQLCMKGCIQIDAVGSWIKDFSIDHFKRELCSINKTIVVHTGNNKKINKYEIKCDSDYTNAITINPNVSEYFVSVGFYVEQTQSEFDELFFDTKMFFKEIASRFPSIKMSITGDLKLLQESKSIRMIGESLNDVLKYSYSEVFREEILKKLQVQNKQQVIEKVCNILTHKLKMID